MPLMRRPFLFVQVFTLLSALCLSAQTPKVSLLPIEFGSWQPGNRAPITMWPRSAEAGKLDAHPEYEQTLKESGILRIEERYYRKADNELTVRLFKLRDPSGAYEIYTSRLRPEMVAANVGQVSATDSQGSIALVGNIVFESTAGTSPADLAALVRNLEAFTDKTPLPPIPTFLPTVQHTKATERYALGPAAFRAAAAALGRGDAAALVDVAGFDSGAEAMFAKYKAGRDEATLLLIEYPTPQLAELHLRHLQRALSADKKNGSSVERKGSLLSIILGPTSAAYAEKLRGAVNYETEVTWNEPSTTATDPPITSTLVKIIIATMVLMVMALVLGIAFGGVRIITKRLFPGKVFDRPARMEVLQLGLSGKPIDPRDMY
jgi:hypothetical protein